GLYQRFLGRAADPAGRAAFVGYLQNGGTLEGVSRLMLASAEYQSHFPTDAAFIQSLYQNLLHRTGSNAEVAAWQPLLPQLGRGGVVPDFLSSGRVPLLGGRGRLLSASGPRPAALGLRGQLLGKQRPGPIDTLFAASPEYQLNG